MVQKSFRRNILIVLILTIVISCTNNPDEIKGKLNNSDSVHHTWDYRINFTMYDKNRREIRTEELNIYGLFFFKIDIKEYEEYIKFDLIRTTNGTNESYDINNPDNLFNQESLISLEDFKNDPILYFTSPVLIKKKDENTLQIKRKKFADYYLVYFYKEGEKSKIAFSFLFSNDHNEIDLRKINDSNIVDAQEIIDKTYDFGIISKNEMFNPDFDYNVFIMAFKANYENEFMPYTNQAFSSSHF